jgi:ribosomal protein L11 methyltransferase
MEKKPSWIEITVEVLTSDADAVANFLIENGSNGIVEESRISIAADRHEESLKVLKGYIINDANSGRYINNLNQYLKSINILYDVQPNGKSCVSLKEIHDEDWNELWKSFFQPVKVTRHIVIKPTWQNYWKRDDEIVIEIDPGMAFGTGTHASTRLCLQALEDLIENEACTGNFSLLDVGTGSGILSIAGSLLGAKKVWGIDIDPVAITCAEKNAVINKSAGSVVFATTPLQKVTGLFNIIVANILPLTLIAMKDDLLHHLAPGGQLILSGILTEKASEVIEAFVKDILFVRETTEGEWSCLLFRNR